MSLQVWLPLDGDIRNNGLTPTTSTVNGTLNYITPGYIWQGAVFNGTNTSIHVSPNIASGATEFTVMMWIKPATTKLSGLFGFQNGSSYQFTMGNQNNILCYRDNANSSYAQWAFNAAAITAEIWQHVCFQYDNGVIRFYHNGVLQDSTSTGGAHLNTMADCWIGQSYQTTYFFNGMMNDVKIYDHAVSAKEIANIALGLISHYSFDLKEQILPAEYERLEYLQSTGTQYIRTGLIYMSNYFNNLTNYAVAEFTELQQRGNLGGYDSGGQFGQANGLWSVETNTSSVDALVKSSIKQVFDLSANKDTLYQNDTAICSRTISGAKNTAKGVVSYPLFGASNNGTTVAYQLAKVKIYSFIMYADGKLVREFVPAKRISDSVLGMYDIVTNVFYINEGTGNFIGGSVLNETVTRTVYDMSGYNYNAEIINTFYVTGITPRYLKAIVLPTSSSYIQCANWAKLFNTAATWSFSCWYNSNLNPPISNLLWVSYSGDWYQFNLDGAKLYTRNSTNGYSGARVDFTIPTTGMVQNEWQYFVITFNHGHVAFYINAVLIFETDMLSNATTMAAPPNFTNNNHLFLARTGQMSLSDVRLYRTTLTTGQIEDLYNTSMNVDSSGNISARILS